MARCTCYLNDSAACASRNLPLPHTEGTRSVVRALLRLERTVLALLIVMISLAKTVAKASCSEKMIPRTDATVDVQHSRSGVYGPHL